MKTKFMLCLIVYSQFIPIDVIFLFIFYNPRDISYRNYCVRERKRFGICLYSFSKQKKKRGPKKNPWVFWKIRVRCFLGWNSLCWDTWEFCHRLPVTKVTFPRGSRAPAFYESSDITLTPGSPVPAIDESNSRSPSQDMDNRLKSLHIAGRP